MFDRLARVTGLTVRPHLLRHMAATTWLAQGTPRDTVQHLLGHVSPTSMGPYLHPNEADKRAAVELAVVALTGMRIGETLGLHRQDMHLLAHSRSLGCAVAGPHLHVRRRADNANGALAKSRFPRSIPVPEAAVKAGDTG